MTSCCNPWNISWRDVLLCALLSMNMSKLIQNGRWETETKWETLLQMSSSLIPFRLLLCLSTEGKFTLCSLLLWIWTFVLSHLHPMFWCCGWIYRVCCQSEQKEFLVSLVVFWWCQVWVSSVHVGNQRNFSSYHDILWHLMATKSFCYVDEIASRKVSIFSTNEISYTVGRWAAADEGT